MPVLRSRLDPAAVETRVNHDAMAALVDDLRQRQNDLAQHGAGGDDRSIERHKERGKLPVRERIDRLLDPGSPFLELSPLAANTSILAFSAFVTGNLAIPIHTLERFLLSFIKEIVNEANSLQNAHFVASRSSTCQ